MDQGVFIQAMKNRYKRKLLQKVICDQDLDPTQNIKEIVKQHTVKDALYMLADAWEDGHADSIFKAYSKLQIHPVHVLTMDNGDVDYIVFQTIFMFQD